MKAYNSDPQTIFSLVEKHRQILSTTVGAVVPKVGCTAPWETVELPMGGVKSQEDGRGALEVGPSKRIARLFTMEVAVDRTLGNWYHFIKPIHRTENLLKVK
jgi:hypothetical protein